MRYLFLLIALVVCGCEGPPASKTDSGVPDVAADIKEVPPAEAQPAVSKAYSQFIDVRTPEEYASGHAARSVNIPLDKLTADLARVEPNEPVYLICESGGRSLEAARMLKDAGYNNVVTVAGGMAAWRAANLPIENEPPHANRAPVR